MNNTRN